jgi:broad specificity phosphatase PhoE/predicted kinase
MTQKLALVMVGLPARGKTFVARKIARFLTWQGRKVRLFNAGDYRRAMFGAKHSHEFFRPDNPEGKAARQAVAEAALDDLFSFLGAEGEVAIYDATNTTRSRRQLIRDRCERAGVAQLFVEIVCDDPDVIEANIRETKVHSPDYVSEDPDAAVRDFRARLSHYEKAYEPLQEDVPFIKYIDKGKGMVLNRVHGELAQLLVLLLMNLRSVSKPVWLTRHGESLYNSQGLLGGDPDLSANGLAFAKRLSRYVDDNRDAMKDLVVWTSSLKRTFQTVRELGCDYVRELDELNAGKCEGMSYEDIARDMPEEFAARKRDKFRYRYPRGESYQDLIRRLTHVVLCYEREPRPLLVVGHQAVLRAFYAYLTAAPPETSPHIAIPLHTVIALRPKIYDMEEHRVVLE